MTLKEAQSYLYIHRQAQAIASLIHGAKIHCCYSQNKEELVIGFEKDTELVYIVANLLPTVGLLKVSDSVSKATKNVVTLFEPILNTAVIQLYLHQHERSYYIQLSNQMDLIFKLHGPNSNIMLGANGHVLDVFRSQFANDSKFNYLKYPTLEANPLPDQSLLNEYNQLFKIRVQEGAMEQLRKELLQKLTQKIAKNTAYVSQNLHKKQQLMQGTLYEHFGHILMAQSQLDMKGQKSIEVTNFYTDASIQIALKPELNLKQNAAIYFKKGKNQKIELDKLQSTITAKQEELKQLEHALLSVQQARTLNELLPFQQQSQKGKQALQTVPYHAFQYMGFDVWAGKNAQANDQLLRLHAHKNDLWFHARDAAGSHVLIKWQAGKPFPKPVIEYAASLAAYFSNRKTEALVRVSYTERKYIRKPKGAAPGLVVMDKEETILMPPLNPFGAK